MENEETSFFSVTYFNGETELDMGIAPITPSLTFKSFQSLISQKIKISRHQFTIYLQRKDFIPSFKQNYHRHRLPVTSKFNFSSIMTESNSVFFWVVQTECRCFPKTIVKNPSCMIYRRNLEMYEEQQRNLMSMSVDSLVNNNLGFLYRELFNGASSSSHGERRRSIKNPRPCGICMISAAMGVETPPFHRCKNKASSGPTSGYTIVWTPLETEENRGWI
ncbi:unnamed protein product [Amaranthus hypochondriacus]